VTLRARGGGRPPVKTGTTATSQPPPTRPPSTGKPPPTVGTGEIVNPWAK
jgi:hypothetical protein